MSTFRLETGFREWCEDYVTSQRRYFSDSRVDFCAEMLEDMQFPWDATIVHMTRYWLTQWQRQMFQSLWNIYTQEALDDDYVPSDAAGSAHPSTTESTSSGASLEESGSASLSETRDWD
jgi:hypothetical protein